MSIILIYVTHENLAEAKKVSDHLLQKKLIACANFMPISASFWWNTTIDSANEFVSIFKTREELWQSVKTEIEKVHPYKIPCIMKMVVEANKAFEDWIVAETQQR